jgi:hypothetical protein
MFPKQATNPRQPHLGCRFLAAVCLTFISVALGPSCAQAGTEEPDFKVFDLAADPDFRDHKQVITEFARKHRPGAENDFCVVGYLTPDNLKSAWVIWRQGAQVILWEGGSAGLDSSRRKINLRSDVVRTENDLHGSTYLVTKAWVQKVTTTCDRSGVKVHIAKGKH